MLDLDAIERGIRPGAIQQFSEDELRELVAELRTARRVIESILADTENEVSMRTDMALDDYERATAPWRGARLS